MPGNETILHSVPCTQNQNIADIKSDLRKIHKIIDGNGENGMKTDIAIIKEKLSGTMEVNTELEITRRVNEHKEKIRKEYEAKKNVRFGKTAQVIGLVFTGIAVITSLVLGVLSLSNTKKIPTVEDRLVNEVRNLDGVSGVRRSIDGDTYLRWRDEMGLTDSIRIR